VAEAPGSTFLRCPYITVVTICVNPNGGEEGCAAAKRLTRLMDRSRGRKLGKTH